MKRSGWTLVEILVAILIMTILMGAVLMFLPKTESRLATQGADQLQTFIASARARAMRDGVPTGVRLISNDSGVTFREYVFVQTPEPYAPTLMQMKIAKGATSASFIQLTLVPATGAFNTSGGGNVDMSGSVAVGDLMEISSTGSVHRVTGFNADNSVQFAADPVTGIAFTEAVVSAIQLVPVISGAAGNYQANGNAGFRFIREPRPLMGETPQQLPRYVKVNGGSSQFNAFSYSGAVANQIDIIFSPSGQVINSTAGRVILWIDDDNTVAQPSLLCIYARTGGVAAHPVANGADPYAFTKDGLNSGQ